MSKKTEDQLPGQMNLFDYIEKPKTENGDCGTCEWSFWKHGKETVRGCQYHGGKDGCHYEKRKTCRSCAHMKRSVYGLMEYHGFACFGFGISKSDNLNNNACHDYEPAADGEAWRTSDKAVDEWLGMCEEESEGTHEHTD